MHPKISKVISTTVLQYMILLFLVYRWLRCRISCDLHVSNHFWQTTDLKSPGMTGGVRVPFYFLTCLKKGGETCSGVDSFGPRDVIVSKMLAVMFMTWDFHTSKLVIQVENDTTFPVPQVDMGTAYDHIEC